MASARVVWNGNPGEIWTNATAIVRYQMVCDLVHTCGTCLQYHMAISNWWPIPFHRNCRCRQLPIVPGGSAQPFQDFRKILDDLSPTQKREAIGASNYKLLDAGIAKWEDIVTPTRVRDLQEVAARLKLTVEHMVDVGVKPRFAEQAFARVHTPKAEMVREKRRELIANLRGAGISKEKITKYVTEHIGQRVSIGGGPSGAQAMPQSRPRPRVVPTGLPGDLVSGLKHFEPKPFVSVRHPKPSEPVLAKPPPPKTPPTVDAAIAERLKALPTSDSSADRLARREAIQKVVQEYAKKGVEGKFHGMDHPEQFSTLKYRGLEYNFSGEIDSESGIVLTIESLDRRNITMPSRLESTTHSVYLTRQANNKDVMWERVYKMPNFKAHATGGDGNIVVYGGNGINPETLAHEAGHNLAKSIYGNPAPSHEYGRLLGSTTEEGVSAYAKVSPAEDFAESVKLYVVNPRLMKSTAPERYQIIEKIMRDFSYGG